MSPVHIGGAFVGVGTTYKHLFFPYTTYILWIKLQSPFLMASSTKLKRVRQCHSSHRLPSTQSSAPSPGTQSGLTIKVTIGQCRRHLLPQAFQGNNLGEERDKRDWGSHGPPWSPSLHPSGRRYLVWLLQGPVLETLEDPIITLNNPVFLYGGLLHPGGCNGHAEAHFQDPAP